LSGQKKEHGGPYPAWTDAEDRRLLDKLDGRQGVGQEFWIEFAAEFPARSFYAVRQRYLTLRQKASGLPPKPRVRHTHPVKSQKHRRFTGQEPVVAVPPQPPHETLTAFLCGDPLPGRSALDQKRSASA
jgi:hypothetical protein